MSERVVEMIEALQKEWFGVIEARKKNGQDGTIEAVIGMHARSLQPILAAARAQEQELAALHEQIMCYQADPQYDARFLDGQDKTEAAIKKQHSADLREIAEMAIHGCLNWPSRGTWPTADSIVHEFREKKAKVGK